MDLSQHKLKVEKYFDEKGIDVVFNTLGKTEALMKSYVFETQDLVDNSDRKSSHYVKNSCYSRYFDIEPRTKFTGFESFEIRSKELRRMLSPTVKEAQFSTSVAMAKNVKSDVTYKNAFKQEYTNDKEKFLYLSGGIDSEFAAYLLIESNIAFTPVIFKWTNNNNEVQNEFDIQYAIDFCKKNEIDPIIETLNIEELWNNPDFINYAHLVGLISPHLLTHAYMVEFMDKQFPGRQHLFGGEVRYTCDYQINDTDIVNLVKLQKVTPGYDGLSYTLSKTGLVIAYIWLEYQSTGSWNIIHSPLGSGFTGSPITGTWTNTPGSIYECQISDVNTLYGDGIYTLFPDAPTSWFTITTTPPSNPKICEAMVEVYGNYDSDVIVIFTIQVRSVAQPAIVMTSTIELSVSVVNS